MADTGTSMPTVSEGLARLTPHPPPPQGGEGFDWSRLEKKRSHGPAGPAEAGSSLMSSIHTSPMSALLQIRKSSASEVASGSVRMIRSTFVQRPTCSSPTSDRPLVEDLEPDWAFLVLGNLDAEFLLAARGDQIPVRRASSASRTGPVGPGKR